MNIRPAAFVVKDGQVLLLRYEYGGTTVHNLPGGNLEFGEDMKAALARELEEELGVTISVGPLICLGDVYVEEKQKHTLHLVFEASLLHGEPAINPQETSAAGFEWLPVASLTALNLYPFVGEALQQFAAGQLPNPYLGRIQQPWY